MRKITALFTGLILILVVPTPAYADTTKPTYVSGAVTPNSAAIRESVTVEWSLQDDTACCSLNRIILVPAGMTIWDAPAFYDAATLVSGDLISGTYSRTFAIPNIPSGIYEVTLQFRDQAGLYGDLQVIGNLTITGNNIGDLANPVIEPNSGVPSSLSGYPGFSVSLKWHVTEDLACCQSNRINIVDGNNTVLKFYTSSGLVSGTTIDGMYGATFTIPNLTPGTYPLKAQVIDNEGKYSKLEQVATLTILKPDLESPVVTFSAGAVASSSIARGSGLAVDFTVSDDVNCCSSTLVKLYDQSGVARVSSTANLVSGSALSGSYRATVAIPTDLTLGVYDVKVLATDISGKQSNLVTVGTVTVIFADTLPPTIQLSEPLSSSYSAGSGLQAKLRVMDETGCCISIQTYIYNSAGSIVLSSNTSYVSGLPTDTVNLTSFVLPSNLPSGTYSLRAQATDNKGNASSRLTIGTFLVNGIVLSPSLATGSGYLSKTSIVPGSYFDASFSVQADPDSALSASIRVESNGSVLTTAQATRQSKSGSNAQYGARITIPANYANSTLTVTAQIVDPITFTLSTMPLGTLVVTPVASLDAPSAVSISRPTTSSLGKISWTQPALAYGQSVAGFRVEVLTTSGSWGSFCSTTSDQFACTISADEISGQKVLAFRVWAVDAIGNEGAKSLITYEAATTPTSTSTIQATNAGSFKGYVAIYAKGYAGKRLSAKVGKDWVVVPSLKSDFERVVEFTGAGYKVSVKIYIDGVLTNIVALTTK